MKKFLFLALILAVNISFSNIDELVKTFKIEQKLDKRTSFFDVYQSKTNPKIVKGVSISQKLKDDFLEVLKAKGIVYIDSIEVLPEGQLKEKPFAIAINTVVDLRAGAGYEEELLTQVMLGTVVKVYKKKSYWYYCQTPDGYLGWIDAGTINLVTPKEKSDYLKSERLIYTDRFGFVVNEQDTNRIVADIIEGNILQKIGEIGNFNKVKYADGRTGLVSKSKTTDFQKWVASRQATADNLISKAFSFLGIQYSWGGTTPKGLDCSGSVKTYFFLNGLILQRDASQQYLYGESLDISNGYDKLVPGDLLYFGKINEGKKKVSHTGMYIGNGEFIHCSGRLKLNSFDPKQSNYSEDLKNRFIHASRYIGNEGKPGIQRIADSEFYFEK